MESSQPTRHFKPPWTLTRENSECYVVRDANGVTVAWLFCRDDSQRYSVGASKLTSEEARRIGKAIPEFMMQRQGFYSRGGGPRWRADRNKPPQIRFGEKPYQSVGVPITSEQRTSAVVAKLKCQH
jgi:hypothetical protein